MRKTALLIVLVVCLGAAQAFALSDKPYLTATDADFGNILPPPPVEGSALDKRDLQGVLDLQKALTPARMEKIQADVEQTVYRVAGEVLGPTFTKERFPITGEFFTKINQNAAVGVRDIKQKYKKQRAFQASSEVKTPENIARASMSPTYPSGHATFGAQVALLLSMMVPEKTHELHARGREYGEQRVASGVAYPSDFETAQIGATLMIALMMQKPEFRDDFQVVKTEVRKGLGLAP